MIIKLLSYFLLLWTFYNSYKMYQSNPKLIRSVYLKNIKDYIWSFLLVILVMSTVIFLITIGMPDFLKFSWLNLLGGKGTNLITSTIIPSDGIINIPIFLLIIITSLIYAALVLCLPYLAKVEEEIFRSGKITIKQRLISSIKFGLLHLVVGVPIFASLILCVIGWIFSIRYIKSYNSNLSDSDFSYYDADRRAVIDCTSLHSKYNFITITIAYLFFLILFL